tara:strand:- start:31310 stop:31726 length:417 start_codon:yes stop_codon:yes gene_type:complete
MIKLNTGFLRIESTFNQEELNFAIKNYVSRVHEVELSKTSIIWDKNKEPELEISEDMDYGCKINLISEKKSETHQFPYKEMMVLQESSDDMKINLVYMVIDFLDLDDHEYARDLKSHEIKINPENKSLTFVLNFNFNE